jgi:hypothetical protein
MARIVLGATAVRYPLGGMNQWILAWLVGFRRLGHDVYLVEKSGWQASCYDPSRKIASDDCSYGVAVVNGLLNRFGLGENWCFVDATGHYHGLSQKRLEEVFQSADLFVDLEGTEWVEECAGVPLRVLVDGEPGWLQMKIEKARRLGQEWCTHDYYYTAGLNIGTARTSAPTGGKTWRPLIAPVLMELFPYRAVLSDAPFSTVMNWKSNKHIEFDGVIYGQKEVEFAKFIDLPRRTAVPMEVAVSGANVPRQELREHGWRVLNADDVARSVDTYREYIVGSRAGFTVVKHVFAATNCGWFGDREGYYMASGRPVVVEETGFSAHLPCGLGVLAVNNVEEAAQAIEEINGNFERHSRAAREIAVEFLDAPRVLGRFLQELGVS